MSIPNVGLAVNVSVRLECSGRNLDEPKNPESNPETLKNETDRSIQGSSLAARMSSSKHGRFHRMEEPRQFVAIENEPTSVQLIRNHRMLDQQIEGHDFQRIFMRRLQHHRTRRPRLLHL